MRKISSLLLCLVCVGAFASTAMAKESMYQAGDTKAYIGYSALNDVSIPVNGFTIGGEYFFTEMISFGVEGNFLSESAGGITLNYSNLNGQIGYHGSISDTMGVYMKAGYGSTTFTITGATGSAKASGLVYELGVESKFSSNIAGHIGYKSIAVTIGGATFDINGLTGGVDFIF